MGAYVVPKIQDFALWEFLSVNPFNQMAIPIWMYQPMKAAKSKIDKTMSMKWFIPLFTVWDNEMPSEFGCKISSPT